MKNRLVSQFVALSLVAVPALAQDGSESATKRTPAAAQTFLAAMPPHTIGSGNQAVIVASVSSPDACRTVFTGAPGEYNVDRNSHYPVAGASAGSLEIDWSDVRDISIDETRSATNGSVLYELSIAQKTKPGHMLYFPFEAERNRFQAAASYLKDACDKTKDLAF